MNHAMSVKMSEGLGDLSQTPAAGFDSHRHRVIGEVVTVDELVHEERLPAFVDADVEQTDEVRMGRQDLRDPRLAVEALLERRREAVLEDLDGHRPVPFGVSATVDDAEATPSELGLDQVAADSSGLLQRDVELADLGWTGLLERGIVADTQEDFDLTHRFLERAGRSGGEAALAESGGVADKLAKPLGPRIGSQQLVDDGFGAVRLFHARSC